jgi:HPt (histidine-containing phosphotransfer) domain-containing protein
MRQGESCQANLDDEDVAHGTRRRILGAYLSASLTLGPAYALFFAYFGAWWSFWAPAAFTGLSLASWVFKRRNACRLATNLLLGGLWLGPAWAVLTTGALDSPLLIWLTPTPFMAGALLGRRAAIAVGAASVGLVLLLGLFGVDAALPRELMTGAAHHWFEVMSGASAVGLLTFYGYATTRNFEDAQAKISAQHAEVVSASLALTRRNQDMAAVLDNVAQGLLLVDLSGRILPGHSAMLTRAFGVPPEGGLLWDFAATYAPTTAAMLQLGWEDLAADVMPRDVVLGQLPTEVLIAGRTWSLQYQAVGTPEQLQAVLIVMSDVTEARLAAQAQATAAETLALFERFVADPATFASSRAELDALVRSALEPQELRTLARRLHTIKGTAAACGLLALPALVHRLETTLEEAGALSPTDLQALHDAWAQVTARTQRWADASRGAVVVHDRELATLREAISSGAPARVLLGQLERWRWERVEARFDALAVQARTLAARLGKPGLQVELDARGLVVPPGALEELWLNLVHVVRNAVDHGVEAPQVRVAAGKPAAGHLTFRAREAGGRLLLTFSDDGAGIDWARVAAKARALGLAAETRAELEAALFSDGLSTRDAVTDVSGRGVGLSAILHSVQALGGRLLVDSPPGQGTTWTVELPLPGASLAAAA